MASGTAGPSILLKFLADVSGVKSAVEGAASSTRSAGDRMHEAFSGAVAAINKTGVLGPFGDALAGIDQGIDDIKNKASELGPKMMGVGTTAMGVGLVLQDVGSKEKAASQQLQAAIENTGHSYDQYAGKVDSAVKKQEAYGHSAAETKGALQSLTQATNDPAKALQYLGTASDLAAAKHESLGQAAETVGKAYNGSAKALREFGLRAETSAASQQALKTATNEAARADEAVAKSTQNAADIQAQYAGKTTLTIAEQQRLQHANEAVSEATAKATDAHSKLTLAQDHTRNSAQAGADTIAKLSDKLKGQASASADSFGGKMHAMQAKVEDAASAFGQKFGPAITIAGAAMTGTGAAVETMKAAHDALANSTKLAAAAQWLMNAATAAWPGLLIVIALAALVAALVLAYQHVTWFRDAINDMGRIAKDIFEGVVNFAKTAFDWLAAHWPLILAILLGPFALAVYGIATHWNAIVDFAKGIPDKIKNALGNIGKLLEQAGKDLIEGFLRGITSAFHDVENFMKGAADKVGGFLKNPLKILSPSRVMAEQGAYVMQGLGQGLQQGFNQHVQPALDQVTAAMLTPPTFPGGGAAAALRWGKVGGAGAAGRSGPAVVINDAHFAQELDVQSFMKHAAWAAQTSSI